MGTPTSTSHARGFPAGREPWSNRTMVVCLVEDDKTVLLLLSELLQRHGHTPKPVLVMHGDTVASSLDRIAETGARVVVMDLGMPVPGADILAAAQRDARFEGFRYVIATASFDAARDVPSVPGVARVAKPYDFDELLSALGSGA